MTSFFLNFIDNIHNWNGMCGSNRYGFSHTALCNFWPSQLVVSGTHKSQKRILYILPLKTKFLLNWAWRNISFLLIQCFACSWFYEVVRVFFHIEVSDEIISSSFAVTRDNRTLGGIFHRPEKLIRKVRTRATNSIWKKTTAWISATINFIDRRLQWPVLKIH